MILNTLPDAKTIRVLLSVGQDYHVIKRVGNCFAIQTANSEIIALVLETRFDKPE